MVANEVNIFQGTAKDKGKVVGMLECWFEFIEAKSLCTVFVEYTKTAGHGEDSHEREFDLKWDKVTGKLSGAWNGLVIGG